MFYIYAFAYMSMVFAFLVLLGTALHFLFEWCERDEATERTIYARHRR